MRVVFNSLRPWQLKNLITGGEIPVVDGAAMVDIDRKAGEVFRVEL
jgi:hypothetical protein